MVDSAASPAVRAFNAMAGDPERRREVALKFASAIQVAAEKSPASWVTTWSQSGQYVRLDVGALFVLTLRDGSLSVIVDSTAVDRSDPELAGWEWPGENQTPFKSAPELTYCKGPLDEVLTAWPKLESAHLEAVRQAVGRCARTPFARYHRPELADVIAEASGVEIGQPELVRAQGLEAEDLVTILRIVFPGWEGFGDPRFAASEVTYKREACALARELLGRTEMERLIEAGEHAELLGRLKKVGQKTNLLFMGVPSAGDLGILYQESLDTEAFGREMVELLHGEGDAADRLERYLAWVHRHELPSKWTFPTYYLFLLHPETEFFIKPTAIQNVLRLLDPSDRLPSKPSAEEYRRIRGVMQRLFDALQEHGPRDMIDIQGLAWVCGGTRIWKIAPGERGRLWDDCRRGGYISIGWDELGDLSNIDDKKAFDAKGAKLAEEHDDWTVQGLQQLWTFRSRVREGDIVVANRGINEVLGIGSVTSDYYFERGEEQGHRRRVTWLEDANRAVEYPGWRRTLIELSPVDLKEIWESPRRLDPPPPPPPAPAEDFEAILRALGSKGLYFPQELVANYLLALQTKRFAILTGISGTGKTQLALAVAERFPAWTDAPEALEVPEGALVLTVQPYTLKYGNLGVPVEFSHGVDWEALTDDDGRRRIPVEYDGQSLDLNVWRDQNRNVTVLSLRGELKQWFKATFSEGDECLMEGIEDEDGRITALRMSKPSSTHARRPIRNVEVVAVRPDWTDHRGLLGYFNPLTGQYVRTPFLELAMRAREEWLRAGDEGSPAAPFFAILDEMNLARVEHYFSDLLSCMESGKPIHLHDDDRVAAGETEDAVVVPKDLPVPPNVFVVGTVNVDETTYMFSPKVLDRAFTLELNEVDLAGYAGPPGAAGDGRGVLDLPRFEGLAGSWPKPGRADWDAFGGLDGGWRGRLVQLNEILESEGRHFGYRVANEIGRFVTLAERQTDGSREAVRAAFDLAVLQKVLPKLHGTQQELHGVIRRLFGFAVAPGGSGAELEPTDLRPSGTGFVSVAEGGVLSVGEDGDDTSPTSPQPVEPELPRTARKLWRMARRLNQRGFVAYIE